MKRLFWLVPLCAMAYLGVVEVRPSLARAQVGEIRMKIRLTGAAVGGLVPEGNSEFRSRGSRTSFKVEANRVNLADGSVLTASVNGRAVGTFVLSLGRGKLDLDTERRNSVPVIQKGDVVTVATSAGGVILSGRF